MDFLATFIKRSGHFRGKGHVLNFWLKKVGQSGKPRSRRLPGEAIISCDMSVPYEAMVWLEREEQGDLEMLTKLLSPGQTFIDCGANIGIWSIVAASAVGPTGKVVAFEPNPATGGKLRNNVTKGGWDRITIVPKAVGHREGETTFKCEAAHNVSRVTQVEEDGSIKVPVVTLDAVLTGSIDGCKIDVEGYELKVLEGAEQLLKRDRPWLCVEFNTTLTQSNKLSDWDVHKYLRGLGYSVRKFQDALDHSAATVVSEEWETEHYCNLFYSVDGGQQQPAQ